MGDPQPHIFEHADGRLELINCTFDMGKGGEGKHYKDLVWYRTHRMAPYEITVRVSRLKKLPKSVDAGEAPVDLAGMMDEEVTDVSV